MIQGAGNDAPLPFEVFGVKTPVRQRRTPRANGAAPAALAARRRRATPPGFGARFGVPSGGLSCSDANKLAE